MPQEPLNPGLSPGVGYFYTACHCRLFCGKTWSMWQSHARTARRKDANEAESHSRQRVSGTGRRVMPDNGPKFIPFQGVGEASPLLRSNGVLRQWRVFTAMPPLVPKSAQGTAKRSREEKKLHSLEGNRLISKKLYEHDPFSARSGQSKRSGFRQEICKA